MCQLFTVVLALAGAAAASFAAERFRPLNTELKVGSVSVAIRAPLGFRYRPGETFPLEIHVTNPGSALNAEIVSVESGADSTGAAWAERGAFGEERVLPSGTSRYLLPMRAPGVSATVDLIIHGSVDGGGKAELFRASLSRELHPLPAGGRIVVFCSGGAATVWAQDQAARLNSEELPQEDWMWEGVDWLVLSDASILSARPEALDALRRWLLGGGRVLLRSHDALSAALSIKLLPFEALNDIPADVNWWQKNAGLRNDDVLVSKNFRPVYARLKHGFGQIIFLFPGSQPSTADEAAVFNRPDLQRHRAQRPDARVQPERFAAFAPSETSDPQRRTVMLWALAGALILCIALLFARTSRSRFETALIPIGVCALLFAVLANGFPQQELTVSRVASERISTDGASIVREEWTFLEAFHQPIQVSASGPANGMLAPRFDEQRDLRAARLSRVTRNGIPTLEKIAVAPHQPAMLFATAIETRVATKNVVAETTLAVESGDSLRVRFDALNGVDRRCAIWVRSDGSVLLLQLNESAGSYRREAYTLRALEAVLAQRMDAALAKARAVAIGWALNAAIEEGRGALIMWGETANPSGALVTIHGPESSAGDEFHLRTIQLNAK